MGISCGNLNNNSSILELKSKYPNYHIDDPSLIKKVKNRSTLESSEVILCEHLKLFNKYKEELQKLNPYLHKLFFKDDTNRKEFEIKNLNSEEELKFYFFFNKRNIETLIMKECNLNFPKFSLQYFPSFTNRFSTLKSITINNSKINFLEDSENYLRLTNLIHLDLSFNSIDALSQRTRRLTNLKVFNLKRNNFLSIPTSIADLDKLIDLNLSQNNIKTVDSFLFKLKLEKIDLSMNKINEIKFNSTFIKNSPLKYFYLNYNELDYISESYGNFPCLLHLALENNKIVEANYTFKNIRNNLIISLNGNPLRTSENLINYNLDYGHYFSRREEKNSIGISNGNLPKFPSNKDIFATKNDEKVSSKMPLSNTDNNEICLKESDNYLENRIGLIIEKSLSNLDMKVYSSNQLYNDRLIQLRLEVIFEELKNIIENKELSQIAKFSDLGLKADIKICYNVMNKLKVYRINKKMPELTQKEVYLFNFGVNSKNDEAEKQMKRIRDEGESINSKKNQEKSKIIQGLDQSSSEKHRNDLNNLKFLEELTKYLLGSKLKFLLNLAANIDPSFKEYMTKIILENPSNSLILFLTELNFLLDQLKDYYTKNSSSPLEIQFRFSIQSTTNVIHKIFLNSNSLKMLYKLGLKEIVEKDTKVAIFTITHSINEKYKFLHNLLNRFIKQIKSNDKDLQNIY